jgi:hypothetical protein
LDFNRSMGLAKNHSLKTIHHFLFHPDPKENALQQSLLRGIHKRLLDLPENLSVRSMIAFGYLDEGKGPVPKEQLEYEKILQISK